MVLQFLIDEDGFNGLDENMQGMYQKGENGYQLAVEGLPQQEDVSGLKAQRDALLAEKKKAQQDAKAAADAAAKEAADAAKQKGDFEALFKSSEQEREKLQKQYEQLTQKISTEKRQSVAMSVAAELADGNNAKLLAKFVGERIKVDGDNTVVLNANGEPTVSTIDDLKKEFTTSGQFDSLLRGNKASGGGATGSKGGGAAKEVSRADFEAMDHGKRAEFAKSGGKVID